MVPNLLILVTECGSKFFDLDWEPQFVVPNPRFLVGSRKLRLPTFQKIWFKNLDFLRGLEKKGYAQKNLNCTALLPNMFSTPPGYGCFNNFWGRGGCSTELD